MNAHTTDQTGSLLVDWFQKNRLTLVAFAAIVLGLGLYNKFVPKMQHESRVASWDLMGSIMADGATAFSGEQIEGTLAQARQDDRVFPWIVAQATSAALRSQDDLALSALAPELERLASSNLGIFVNGEDLFAQLAAKISTKDSATISTLPATGRAALVSLTDSAGTTYGLSYNLYENESPEACARFISAVNNGTFADQELTLSGNGVFRAKGLCAADAKAEPLPLERQFGLFHEAGTLSTAPDFTAGPNKQSGEEIQIIFEDAYHQDGRATVFGLLADKSQLAEIANRAEGALRLTSVTLP